MSNPFGMTSRLMFAAGMNASGGNLIDSVVGFVSPHKGLKRLEARSQVSELSMNYEVAKRSSRTRNWARPSTSADAAAAVNGARRTLRYLARDFVRSRPHAVRGVAVITGNVVGKGITCSVSGVEKDRKKHVEKTLRKFLRTTQIDAMDELTLPAIQRVAMNAVVTDGEVFIRRRWRSGIASNALVLPFQIEMLEVDFLNVSIAEYGGNEVTEGVEYDASGKIVAYHFLSRHPGSLRGAKLSESYRVPKADVIHIRRIDRVNQTRGVSWFAAVMQMLGDYSDLHDAEIVKQKVASCMTAIIQSEASGDDDVEALDGDGATYDDAGGVDEIELEAGAFVHLEKGQKVEFSNPPSIELNKTHMHMTLAAVAVGLGITFESLTGILSEVNFLSYKVGSIDLNRNVEIWQEQVMIEQLCNRLAGWIEDAWAFRPELGEFDFELGWVPPVRPMLDVRELNMLMREVEAGLTSKQNLQRGRGVDPDQVREERAEDLAKDKGAGLIEAD